MEKLNLRKVKESKHEKVSPETSQRLSNARISFFFKKNQENNGMWKEKLCFHGRGYKNQAYCVQVELQPVFERAREILLQFSKVPFYVCVYMYQFGCLCLVPDYFHQSSSRFLLRSANIVKNLPDDSPTILVAVQPWH